MQDLEDLQENGAADFSQHAAVSNNVRQHRERLSSLAENLRKLGMDDATVDGHVSGLLCQYEHELGHSIRQIELAKTFAEASLD